jgi:hypothetical protein
MSALPKPPLGAGSQTAIRLAGDALVVAPQQRPDNHLGYPATDEEPTSGDGSLLTLELATTCRLAINAVKEAYA